MENLRSTTKKVYLGVILVIVLAVFLYIWFWLLGILVGSVAFSLIVFCTMIGITKFLLFPGAFGIWRRWWQSGLEAELAQNFIDNLQELKYAFEILLNNYSTISHIKKNTIALHDSREIFSVILSSYHNIPESELNKTQRKFVTLIDSFYKNLLDTVIIFPNKTENLWKVLDDTKAYDWSNIAFEDFPENVCLKNTIASLEILEAFVLPICDVKFFSGLIREGIFTNLNLMRLIVESSCNCEHYWVPGEYGEIDCMLIKSSTTPASNPIMLFCNPNGGLYEYSCYQNQWLEFYISLGIDMCVWNYRGYGRSKGSPSADALRTDGQSLYNFLSKVKMYEKIGLHGESIGAMVASHLARRNEPSFLFADRTFSSLHALVSARFPVVNKNLFKCFARWSDSTIEDFLAADCYKILSCDPNDTIVLEPASLKVGIALRQKCLELDQEGLSEFLEAIINISGLASSFRPNFSKEARESMPGVEMTHNSVYMLVSKDIESNEEENATAIVYKLFNAIEIDSGGMPLHCVVDSKQLDIWIRVMQIWGSYSPGEGGMIGKEKTIEKVKNSVKMLADVFKENEFIVNPGIVGLCRQARLLKNGLVKVQKFVECYGRVNADELSIHDEFGNEIHNFGQLVPLSCGHNGKYSTEEKECIMLHLKNSRFIH